MGENFGIDEVIAQIAAGQNGNITRAQLLALGLNDVALNYRVRVGRLFRVYRGVYAVGRPPRTPLEKAAAAVLACGPRAALSHGSAMTLWGLWKRWDEPFEVSIAGDRRPKGIKARRVSGLLRRDIKTEQGIRVTSPARMLLDMAPRMRPRSLPRAINDARRGEILALHELTDVIQRFPFHPGARLLRPHARSDQNPTRSGFEDDFPPFCERFGLPAPRLNIVLHGHEVDAYFEDAKLIVELDGWDFHNDRQAFEDDRERDATMLFHGIATIRITKRRLKSDPGREAARLHSILDARRRRAA